MLVVAPSRKGCWRRPPVALPNRALGAIDFGLELAHEQGSDVTFVHVTAPVEWAVYPFAPLDAVPDEAPVVEDDDVLREAMARAAASGASAHSVSILGDPALELPAYAERMAADLIIRAAHAHVPA